MKSTFVFYAFMVIATVLFFFISKTELKIETYHFYYLILAVIIWFLSYHFFGGRFIRPHWKKAGKFFAYISISFVLLAIIGHYALIFIIGHQLLGGVGHFMICKKHGIDWRTCQPEEKYIALTEKWARGDFSK
jgi:hypothetical protein